MFSHFRALTGLVLVSLLLAACGDAPTPPTATVNPNTGSRPTQPAIGAAGVIRFGAPLGLTGSLAKESKLTQQGYDLWKDAVNAAGGINVGGKKYTVDIKYYDDESKQDKSGQLAEKLINEDKVNFLLGPYGTSSTQTTAAIAEKYEIPMVQGGGASGKIFDRGYKYIFGTLPKAELYFQSAVELAARLNPPVRTAALLYSNEAFDRSVAEGARQWLKEARIDKVYDEEYQPATQDFTSVLAVIKTKSPDLILLAGHEEGALNFIRQSQAADLNPRMAVFTVGPPTADFRKTLGKAAEYIYGITPWLPEMSAVGEIFASAKDFDKQLPPSRT
jgi:branched-chain amino acid transport system substrate-binding protein